MWRQWTGITSSPLRGKHPAEPEPAPSDRPLMRQEVQRSRTASPSVCFPVLKEESAGSGMSASHSANRAERRMETLPGSDTGNRLNTNQNRVIKMTNMAAALSMSAFMKTIYNQNVIYQTELLFLKEANLHQKCLQSLRQPQLEHIY